MFFFGGGEVSQAAGLCFLTYRRMNSISSSQWAVQTFNEERKKQNCYWIVIKGEKVESLACIYNVCVCIKWKINKCLFPADLSHNTPEMTF